MPDLNERFHWNEEKVMLRHNFSRTGLLLAIALSICIGPVAADSRRDGDRRGDSRKPRVEQNYHLDKRHSHYRYYPSRGYVVDRLPRGPVIIPHRSTNYYFHSGIWYQPSGPRFVVVSPPVGLSISVLPPYYTTLWAGGAPYYYADDVYYQWRPSQRDYVIVDPPPETPANSLPSEPESLFVYPRQGQSDEQMANDRYECHRWAVEETGFDPSNLGSGIQQSDLAEKRADYTRATRACLEAREYSVR